MFSPDPFSTLDVNDMNAIFLGVSFIQPAKDIFERILRWLELFAGLIAKIDQQFLCDLFVHFTRHRF
ncbi:hypothetical protein D3C78_1858700 [compost metagenome]